MHRLALSVALALALTPIAPDVAAAGSDRAYPVQIVSKLWRGAVNVLLSPAELPVNSYKEARRAEMTGGNAGQTMVGYGTGFVTGVGYGVARVGVGLFDMVTFPIPTAPVMQPAAPNLLVETLAERDEQRWTGSKQDA